MKILSSYQLFYEGDDLYQDMLSAIAGAQQSILMETYLFAGYPGWDFAKALANKAKQGLEIKIVIDAAGALLYRSHKLIRYLKKHKVKVHLFHRWSWRQPFRYNKRNHRKLLIIDETFMYIGGFNIHDASSQRYYGDKRWLDCHIRFVSPLVETGKGLFINAWRGTEKMQKHYRLGEVLHLQDNENALVPKNLRETFNALWPGAQQYIYLTTPYLVPDRVTQRALIAAATRGIDVRILVPAQGNHKIVAWAARAAYAKLLHHGVRIFEYMPRMLHAKTFVMDDTWASIGSANMDYRSFFLNYELNLFTRHRDICQTLKQHFQDNCQHAREVCKVNWPNRPWSAKVTELIGWFARRWL